MDTQARRSRRGFMWGAAAAGAAVTAAATLPSRTSSPSSAQTQPEPAPERGGGYRLSAHVKQYYKTTLI